MSQSLTVSPEGAALSTGALFRFNSHGFLPTACKRLTVPATVAALAGGFSVLSCADRKVRFQGVFGEAIETEPTDTDEGVSIGDFSELCEPGEYWIELDSGETSPTFRIDSGVWNEPYRLAARAMFLWRCGCAVHAQWRGQRYSHAACHLQDGWLDYVGSPGKRRDATGGWHDAGDYNKYVVNAGVSVGLLFKALEHFGDRIARIPLDLPESGNGVPDLLNELRYELEWLFKMQFEDGKVSHKLTALTFDYRSIPEKDRDRRYFCPWGTAATADFVAMMALAARHFQAIDGTFAQRCLEAARRSWKVLLEHPEHVEPDQSAFLTGGYGAKDSSHRLWAAVELWETTGERGFLEDFERRAAGFTFNRLGPVWYDVEDLALGRYLEASRTGERAPALVARLRNDLLAVAKAAVSEAERNAHGRPLGVAKECWEWGGNGRVAGQTYLLHLANRIEPDPAYLTASQHALAYLLGRNYHGRSYVTGLGHLPPLNPHDRRGGSWPGYLVGGPWPTAKDWFDVVEDYRTNEIAINWNAALIYALAAFAG